MSMTIQEVTGKTAAEYFARLDALVAPGTVERLPMTFREDALVLENLGNLERDMRIWGVGTC